MFATSGGFFETDNDNNANNNGASKSNNFDGDKKKPKMFVPVTLRMLQKSTVTQDDQFEVEGEPITDIIIVGRLLSRDEQPTRTTFDINDNTGEFNIFKVTFYNREENVLPKCIQNLDYEPDCYVKIFGSIRIFKENKAIVGTHITRITDFDELTNHFLQVFTGSCVRRKGLLKNQDLTEGASGKPKTDDEVKETILKAFKEITKDKPQAKKDEIFTAVKRLNINFPQFEKAINSLVDDMAIFSGEPDTYSAF
jgi:replication factor A2